MKHLPIYESLEFPVPSQNGASSYGNESRGRHLYDEANTTDVVATCETVQESARLFLLEQTNWQSSWLDNRSLVISIIMAGFSLDRRATEWGAAWCRNVSTWHTHTFTQTQQLLTSFFALAFASSLQKRRATASCSAVNRWPFMGHVRCCPRVSVMMIDATSVVWSPPPLLLQQQNTGDK